MGSQLAREVSEHWGHLPAGPYKLLMRMALHSLDSSTDPEKPAGHYWRGWQHLSKGLAREIPNPDDYSPEAVTRRRTIQDEIRRHTNTLIKVGAVKPLVDNPGRGTRQVWKLTL